MAKKNKKGSQKKTEKKEFDLPEGLELLEGDGWGNKVMKWLKNNFSAIILPIIALIILGGGIYLYSQQKGEGLEVSEEDLESGITIDLEEETTPEEETLPEEETEPSEEVAHQETETLPGIIEEEGKGGPTEEILPVSKEAKGDYTAKAAAGEGITHLARRTLKEYLQEQNLQLTAEHKIYIEDYLQNRIGTRNLRLGEEISFAQSLIEEAIGQAQDLTDAQLQNLEQYSHLVPSLNY